MQILPAGGRSCNRCKCGCTKRNGLIYSHGTLLPIELCVHLRELVSNFTEELQQCYHWNTNKAVMAKVLSDLITANWNLKFWVFRNLSFHPVLENCAGLIQLQTTKQSPIYTCASVALRCVEELYCDPTIQLKVFGCRKGSISHQKWQSH